MWYSGQLREVMISDTWRKYIRDAGFNNLARVASLCNRAEWEPLPEGIPKPPISKRKILGDASDAALLKCMEVLVKGGAESYRKVCEKVKIINESSLNISRSRRKKKKIRRYSRYRSTRPTSFKPTFICAGRGTWFS